MKSISVRDLRSKSAQIWRELPREKDMIVTSNGRPVGVLSSVAAGDLDKTLATLRRARAMLGLFKMQVRSAKAGLDALPLEDINAEIASARRKRSR